MHRRYGRLAPLRVLLAFLILMGPALQAAPAQASHISSPGVHNASGGAAGAGVSVNPNTGDASYAIPIAVPPGTAGLQPSLALGYDSGSTASSWAGLGWDVPVPSISRSLRGGSPQYSDDYDGIGDEFELGGEALVFVETLGNEAIYETERASFVDIRHNNSTNVWTATRPDGHKLEFGTSAASRVPQAAAEPFEWLLDHEEDTLGNRIDYTYFQQAGVAYLQEVAYGQAQRRYVRFELEAAQRPDTPVSYLGGFEQRLLRRLDHITVQTVSGASPASANIIRRYDLEYFEPGGAGTADDLYESPDSLRTLLRAVTLKGVAAAGGLRTKFAYRSNVTAGTTGWDATWQSWPVYGGGISFDVSDRIADINGDGLADVYRANDSTQKLFLNAGSCFTTRKACNGSAPVHGYPLPTWSNGTTVKFATGSTPASTGVQLADLNRDGRADVFSRKLDLTAETFSFVEAPHWIRSTAGGWVNTIPRIVDSHLAFTTAYDSGELAGPTMLVDLDGDSAPDLYTAGDIQFVDPACFERRRSAYHYSNNGDMTFALADAVDTTPTPGCSGGTSRLGDEERITATDYVPAKTSLSINKSDGTISNIGPIPQIDAMGDLNGDGLGDAHWSELISLSPAVWASHAELNRGDGTFASDPGFAFSMLLGAGYPAIDVNGDGLLDRASTGLFLPGTYLSRGYSSGSPGDAWISSPAWTGSGGVLIDVNGDGMPDLANGTQARLNKGSIPDLLSAVETPYAGRTAISWTTSAAAAAVDSSVSAFPNANAANVGFMPFVKPVVKAIEVDDAKGLVGRTEYTYVRGVFDGVAREFLGFERTTQTAGTSNLAGGFSSQEFRVETKFHQTAALAGLPYEMTISDAEKPASTWLYYPRRTTLIAYGTGTSARLPIRVLEKQSELGTASPTVFRRICTKLVYDANGNATQIDALGLVTDDLCTDNTADSLRSTLIDYATGSARVRDARSRVRLYGAVPPASLLRETKLYYDYSATNGAVTNGLLTQVEQVNLTTPSAGAVTKLAYDAAGRLTAVTNPRESAGEIATSYGTRSIVYAAAGLPDFVSQTQSEPFSTQGSVQRLLSDTSYAPDASCAVATPPMAGLPAVVTDPNGTQTVFCYDTYGRVLSRVVKDSGGAEVARVNFAYTDSPASPTTSPTVTVTQYVTASTTTSATASLDGFGRPILTVSDGPSGTVHQSTTYDALGRVASASLPGNGAPGALSTFGYDGLGREVSRTTPGTTAAVTRYAIDGNYFRVDALAPDNNGGYAAASETRYLSDAFGEMAELREMTGSAASPVLYATTTYKHDAAGAMTEIRDTNGNKTLFAYDGLGRRSALTDPDTGVWTYLYDRNGNLTFQDGPRSTDTLTFQYDLLDRLTVLTRASTGTSKTLAYDLAPTNGLGRFYQERESNEGYGVLVYDALGRPTYERAVAAGKQFDFQTTYNQAGDVLTRTLPTGRVVTYARDSKGYVTGITSASGTEIYARDVAWHFSGQLAAWTAGNDVTTSYGYNATTLLPSSFNAGGVENITAYEYQPDFRLKQTKTGSTVTSSFNYDDLGRLKDATGPYNPGTSTPYAQATLYYGYDAIGNLTCMDASQAPSGTTCTNGKLFTYPAANPTTPPARPHAPTAISGQTAPTYDPAGNMLSGNGRSYAYDPQGQASSITQGATVLTADYAADGRAWKITAGGVTRYRLTGDFEWNQTGTLGRTQVFLNSQLIAVTEELFTPPTYGGCGMVWPPAKTPLPFGGELALLLAYGLAGALGHAGLMRMRRRQRPGLAWVSLGTSVVFLVAVSVPAGMLAPQPAEAASPLNTKYFHPDRLGSSLVVSDYTGAASAKRVVYRPFGALVQNSGATSSVPERGFTGQRFEPSVGVYDYNARWYDPGIARFVKPDPIIAGVFSPQSINPYSYVVNDPGNHVDPTGLDPQVFGVSAGVIASFGLWNAGGSLNLLIETNEWGLPRDLAFIATREGDRSFGAILDGGFEGVYYRGEVEDFTNLNAVQIAAIIAGGSFLFDPDESCSDCDDPGFGFAGMTLGVAPAKGGLGFFVDIGDPVGSSEFILSDFLAEYFFDKAIERLIGDKRARARLTVSRERTQQLEQRLRDLRNLTLKLEKAFGGGETEAAGRFIPSTYWDIEVKTLTIVPGPPPRSLGSPFVGIP